MRSEIYRKGLSQVRIGAVTVDSYLFFPRELGDLLLEPGDEVILVARDARKRQEPNFGKSSGKDTLFDKVRDAVTTKLVFDKLGSKLLSDEDNLEIQHIVREIVDRERRKESENERTNLSQD